MFISYLNVYFTSCLDSHKHVRVNPKNVECDEQTFVYNMITWEWRELMGFTPLSRRLPHLVQMSLNKLINQKRKEKHSDFQWV